MKKTQKTQKTTTKVNADVQKLIDALKMTQADVMKLASIEKQLITAKELKESNKCKVIRQRARNMKFHRHEHEAETIAMLQRVAKSL